VTDRTAKTQV